MKKPKENMNKTTIIHWKNTSDELPIDDRQVLTIIDKSDTVFTMKFDCTYGWIPITDERCSSRPCTQKVIFWSEFNLPK